MAQHLVEFKQLAVKQVCSLLITRWRYVVGLVVVLVCGQAHAATENIAALLSSQLSNIPLVELQKRQRGMECAIGQGGVEDCFVAMPFGAANSARGAEEAQLFLRARSGRVGQLIVSGPVSALGDVIQILTRQYGAPKGGLSRAVSASAPCTELSQWQSQGHSVVVRRCANQAGGRGEFVVNVLADWFAVSRSDQY